MKGKKNRWRIFRPIAGALLLALFFCACQSSQRPPRGTTVTTVPGAADTALPRQLVFAVDTDSPEYIIAAAEGFCRRANSISGGIFTLYLAKSEDPRADLKSGRADIVLLDGGAAEWLDMLFKLANAPFRYGSYEKFAITCNSPQVLRRLSEDSGMRVLAAYYTGSDVFIGHASLDDALNVGRGAEPGESGGQEMWIAAAPNSGKWLQPYYPEEQNYFPGILVTELKDPNLRVRSLAMPDRLAEVPLETALAGVSALHSGEVFGGEPDEKSGVEADEEPDSASDEVNLVVTRSFHNITPMWLILAPSLYEGISPLGQAALDEAAAFMAGGIDGVCLERERELLDALENEGVEISGGFTATRSRIFRAEAERLANMTAREKDFLDLLDRFR